MTWKPPIISYSKVCLKSKYNPTNNLFIWEFFPVLGCCDSIVVVTLPLMYGLSPLNVEDYPTIKEQIKEYDVLLPSKARDRPKIQFGRTPAELSDN